MAKYQNYTPSSYQESDELKKKKEQSDYWNGQQLQNFTFGEQDLSQDYLDTSNALKNLVKPTWEGYSKQGDWDSIYNQLANMKDFSYDVNGDALYQQYKDQYVTGGKMAMMDTMGQASAMTGGYGNSYAQSVGQQAYQGYLQQLNDKVPELYQLALSKYNSDKDNLYRMNDLHQNMFSNEYGMYRDTVSDYNTDRSYLSGRESELYGRDYSKKYDAVTSLNSNIVNERSNANDVYNTLKTSEWGQYMDNETLKKVAVEVANENLYRNEQSQVSALKNQVSALKDQYEGYISPEEQQNIETAENSAATKTLKASVLTPTEFNRRGKQTQIGGKSKRFDNYTQYVDAVLESQYKEGKLTENEVAYLKGYYGID